MDCLSVVTIALIGTTQASNPCLACIKLRLPCCHALLISFYMQLISLTRPSSPRALQASPTFTIISRLASSSSTCTTSQMCVPRGARSRIASLHTTSSPHLMASLRASHLPPLNSDLFQTSELCHCCSPSGAQPLVASLRRLPSLRRRLIDPLPSCAGVPCAGRGRFGQDLQLLMEVRRLH